jgi:protein-S-isoprenylcysteine O-methyltransferase Ste14
VSEAVFHRALAYGVIVIALLVFVLLLRISAPYGRHGRAGWGPTIPTRVAWVVMESPAVWAFALVYAQGSRRADLVPLVMLVCWQLHYVHRSLIYPLRIRAQGKRTPLAVVVMAIVFNLVNAYLNARHISELGQYSAAWFADPRAWLGLTMFVGGVGLNQWADQRLIALRAQGDGYRVPRGGAYRWVSCPNYLGELIEWCGWALLSWSLAGLSFAVFTAANLIPRALSHHRWYRETFDDYPPERRAVLPGIL